MRELQLPSGLVALVDEDDFESVLAAGPWHAKRDGPRTTYVVKTPKPRVQIYLHHFLTNWPETDHINGDGLDNRRSNLRQVTHRQNMANQRLRRDSKSGYKGVNRSRSRWQAGIKVDYRQRHLGTFETAEEAARAYDAAAIAAWGEFARLNFPASSPGHGPASVPAVTCGTATYPTRWMR